MCRSGCPWPELSKMAMSGSRAWLPCSSCTAALYLMHSHPVSLGGYLSSTLLIYFGTSVVLRPAHAGSDVYFHNHCTESANVQQGHSLDAARADASLRLEQSGSQATQLEWKPPGP